ncbi:MULTISPECIES: aminopeptidase P family protein [unclassified Nitratiruptor]|uniref:aminopeptidase P family protein n=1 Tax=unclassified Nitratiruptor TaxID=2624044 RepID=UPI0019157A4B|nr:MULTISPECIES: aminopeptidase P family protein [unclassified Nitratiruptor]BCD59771.1 Xaa-Pro aminopeptidase [Nitratiruptor sp. YY08-10]BCD63695.1 Xaa-Pro aminopeptidase [Nitratiruptor sp. YY08-14]
MNYILKDENAVYYECGFSCDNELLIALGDEKYFLTDARYTTEAKEQIRDAEVIETRNLYKTAREIIRKSGVKRVYFDPKEFSCADFSELSKFRIDWRKRANLSWKKRLIKTEEEIALIKRSVELNAEAFDIFAKKLQECEGWSEKRLHFEAIAHLSRFGEFDLSFDPIFAINENAAKPHALPGEKRLQKGDLILFDAGIKYKRYCSDRTRTACFGENIHFGKEQTFSNPKIQRAYDLVKKAQERAIEAARSGMKAKDLDKVAREIIDKSEFKGTFVHSLGHGVGLDIHEMPFINAKNEQILEDGMVFTIEPGIYIPGEFGIRIEDMVVLRNGRAEVL